jgi:membrane-associated phospholipid phosphatase
MAAKYETFKIYFLFIGLLFIMSWIVPRGHDVLWINGHHSGLADWFLKTMTHAGDGLIFVPVILLLAFVRFQYALLAATVGAAHGALVAIAKQILFHGTPRPKSVLDHELLHFVPGVNVHAINSFPSGHTTTAFCLALLLALIFNNRTVTVLALLVACVVGYSRIYLLQHFLVDVSAGAVLGSITTVIVWESLQRHLNRPWMQLRFTVNVKRRRRVRLPA